MAKVITFSRVFPDYHPKAGQKTNFVQKIWNFYGCTTGFDQLKDEFIGFHKMWDKKHHTIRAGNRWKKNEVFSPRVWSGRPYNSKQITIGPDTLITDVWDFEIVTIGPDKVQVWINNQPAGDALVYCVASNDGLSLNDFKAWFKHPKPFKGQIICWDLNIKY